AIRRSLTADVRGALLGGRAAASILVGDEPQLRVQDHLFRLGGLLVQEIHAWRTVFRSDRKLHAERHSVEGALQRDSREQPGRRGLLRRRSLGRSRSDDSVVCREPPNGPLNEAAAPLAFGTGPKPL